jgi:hypothetical protein
MPWKSGQTKHPYSGRRKGTKNKRTLVVEALFAAHDFNPIERMIELCQDPGVSLEIQAVLLKELAQYAHPKRKAIEHRGEGGGPIVVQVVWDDGGSESGAESAGGDTF